ncbi:Uncharacterized protein TPAR_08666 [Tolypocladium paradoxum]|uniref:DUF7924 domain-containing protein n=1 Tax=Tolypocladium paradoxum TaxID=94208 RepID=A0A2S4KLN0_9HYPO|nr:Uncharacterized protein TPAR_08666 [Tolypocladium paradoxum]
MEKGRAVWNTRAGWKCTYGLPYPRHSNALETQTLHRPRPGTYHEADNASKCRTETAEVLPAPPTRRPPPTRLYPPPRVGVLRPGRPHEDRVVGASEALGRDARRRDEDAGIVALLEPHLVDGPGAEWAEQPAPVQSRGHKRKHSIEQALEVNPDPKQQRPSPPRPAEDAFGEPAISSSAHKHTDPLAFWVKEGFWLEEQDWPEETSKTDFTIDRLLLVRKKSSSNLSRKRSNSTTSTTPSDQEPREEKSAPYRHQRYETLLEDKGSYITKAPLGLASASQTLCRSLLEKTPPVPSDTLFRDDVFETTCQKIHNKNARVIQDISRLIVPLAESLAIFGAAHLDILRESVNEGLNNSIPLTSTRP